MKRMIEPAKLLAGLMVAGLSAAGCASAPPPETAPTAGDSYPEAAPVEPESDSAAPAASEDPVPPAASTAPTADENGETRTIEVIAAFVKERREKVRPCYDAVQKEQPKLKGDLVIHFVLDPQGKVKKADFARAESTIDSYAIADCAIAELKKWQFPASSRGMETEIDYPFNFNPRR